MVVPILIAMGEAAIAAAAGFEAAPVEIRFNGQAAPAPSSTVCGLAIVAGLSGPQVILTHAPPTCVVSLRRGDEVVVEVRVARLSGGKPRDSAQLSAEIEVLQGEVEAELASGPRKMPAVLRGGQTVEQRLSVKVEGDGLMVRLRVTARTAEAAVRWRNLRLECGASVAIPIQWRELPEGDGPPRETPPLGKPIEDALVEWDWRMQDGIGTPRCQRTYPEAIRLILDRGDLLIADLVARGVPLDELKRQWQELRRQWQERLASGAPQERPWEALWRSVHVLRRRIALANPSAQTGPVAFVANVPSILSHQLTQYTGHCARPGGGVLVLEAPGHSMACRRLTSGQLPTGSYEHLDVSFDGRRILFAFCPVAVRPRDREEHRDHFYHLYEMSDEGTNLRQVTDGPYDDFSPRWLPGGQIVFISTRRGGYHRCGRGPCPVHTLALSAGNGSLPRVISFHETHEWDPALLEDGRLVYTRWDYVDRDAVHFQQLWTARPDGSDVRIFYGNNTLNPVGVWEARAVPGSRQIMATAAAHHAMTAGSIILVDPRRGNDGPRSITRLTPDALFPESETPVGRWHNAAGVEGPIVEPVESQRWPGHSYRTAYPLSEEFFLAAYSYHPLVGEAEANAANLFGLYLVDRFGNKELLYRDLNISSLWPMPLRPRPMPPQASVAAKSAAGAEGTFFLQNVYASWPELPREPIRRLRIVEVLPKTTPHIDAPAVGLPHAAPGKQVLGTVPVETDGSAWFRAPARIPLSFQPLDARGEAVQVMRSLTYLQPGETATCIGCHEPRQAAPAERPLAEALRRPPSTITPGPDGSRPMSYPLLVQPVLDRKCVECHNRSRPEGNVVLSGEPEGHYTVSYNALAPRVAYAAWGDHGGLATPSRPGQFGARGSPLMKLLLDGHAAVQLTAEEIERLATWMDANALFYGTFDPADQARQQRGQRIAGATLE
jgi:hypothetical protein